MYILVVYIWITVLYKDIFLQIILYTQHIPPQHSNILPSITPLCSQRQFSFTYMSCMCVSYTYVRIYISVYIYESQMVNICLNIIRARFICLIWLFPVILIFLQNDITSLFMTLKVINTTFSLSIPLRLDTQVCSTS